MGSRWQEGSPEVNVLAIQQSHRRIADTGGRQHGLITTPQLAEAGLSNSAVHKRVAGGRLFRSHRGVYSLTPPPYTHHQIWHAAVLASGVGALLSCASSAELCGYSDNPSLAAHVVVAEGAGRSRPGVVVHRRAIDPRDVRMKDGIPCTSADRVLIDLAPHRTEQQLEILLVAAESLRLIKRPRLSELIDERRGRPGMANLASLIAFQPAIVRSDLELLFLPIWREAGVERPRFNHPVEVENQTLIVDLAWPELRVVVELDSQRFHGDWKSAARDRERDQLLALVGWTPHRFTRAQCTDDRSTVADRLGRLIAAARLG